MNYEAFQSQQRSLKDEERKKKSQAAEALRKYKSDSLNDEASSTLTKLKEQDRQQKLEAEKKLREYRGGVSEEDTKLSLMREEERRKKQEAEEILRGYQSTLSEEEIKLAAMRDDERKKKHEEQQKLYDLLGDSTGDDPLLDPSADVSAIVNVFNAQSPQSVVDKEGSLSVRKTESETALHHSFTAKFMFGVIASKDASIDGYLRAIDEMVSTNIGINTKQAMHFLPAMARKVKFDADYEPPVDSPDIVRRLVTVAIPFKAADESSGKTIKRQIVDAARHQIENGGFRKKDSY